ncbi:hypothetical protein EJB05_44829 [Eragrostis curvula]|uniref:NIF system FeS cluster assembly NifU N-terminal domain-containing protein n=1 Tax=Eragrostis curvula TaxID=38414 RepID=A0A5J9TIK5_9POAL|nr:hypothetical protein EJB05_44829 [Eragrostis curvula]
MLPMRCAAAAAPCSLAALLLRRLSSSSPYSIRRHASSAFSSQTTTTSAATWSPPLPLSCRPRARGFAAWASAPGSAGPAESPATKALEAKIKEQLEADAVTVVDASGDGRHVCSSFAPDGRYLEPGIMLVGGLSSIDVVSKAFEGKSAVNRQRMVYKVIWEELQSTVHAVDQMTTKTPDEAASNK